VPQPGQDRTADEGSSKGDIKAEPTTAR